MTVEEIRDSLLQLDGSLDLTMGGTLQTGVGTDNEFSDGRKSLHPDNTKRRTVYLPLRRSNLATLLTLFDFGDGDNQHRDSRANERRAAGPVHDEQQVRRGALPIAWRNRYCRAETADDARVSRAWYKVLGREPSTRRTRTSLRLCAAISGESRR